MKNIFVRLNTPQTLEQAKKWADDSMRDYGIEHVVLFQKCKYTISSSHWIRINPSAAENIIYSSLDKYETMPPEQGIMSWWNDILNKEKVISIHLKELDRDPGTLTFEEIEKIWNRINGKHI